MENNTILKILRECKSRLIKPDSKILFIDQNFRLSEEFIITFPKLTSLLKIAIVSFLEIDFINYYLFTWENKDGKICGWLNKIEDPESYSCELIEVHELILRNIGGIQETYNQPVNALSNNQNFLFIGSECERGIGDWEEYYCMMCEDYNKEEIKYSHLLSFAQEANGAFTMYDPYTQKVYLFSHDHSFENAIFLANQPEYTFHSIKNVDTFKDYVEELSEQWLSVIKCTPTTYVAQIVTYMGTDYLVTEKKVIINLELNVKVDFGELNAYKRDAILTLAEIARSTDFEIYVKTRKVSANVISELVNKYQKELPLTDEEAAYMSDSKIAKMVNDLLKLAEAKETLSENNVSHIMAANSLLTGGTDSILSTDYLLRGLAGVFTKANQEIDRIRLAHAEEIAKYNHAQVRDFIYTDLYENIRYEIKDAIIDAYKNYEAIKILSHILQYPTGMTDKVSHNFEDRLENMSEEKLMTLEEITETLRANRKFLTKELHTKLVEAVDQLPSSIDKAKLSDYLTKNYPKTQI